MNISFNRNRVQVLFESFLGIKSINDYYDNAIRNQFKSKVLSNEEIELVKAELPLDAIDYLYNGIISLIEGLNNAYKRRYSWSTVQLYYSIYYFLRSSLAFKGIALLQCRGMLRLMTNSDSVYPIGSNNTKYRQTHDGTINHYLDIFSDSDYLSTNTIDGDNSYEWMKQVREVVNYRSRAFEEPYCLSFWDYYDSCINDGTFIKEILGLMEDDTKCFQSDFAIIAVPIKRYQLTKMDYDLHPIFKLSEGRSIHIKREMSSIPGLLHIFSDLLV